MKCTSKILFFATILVIHQTHSMMPRTRLALKELQKASCLKIQSVPIRAFTRSNHTPIKPIINAPKNSKGISPLFLAALGSTALLADSKPNNQFLKNADALVQDAPFYADFLETYITTFMSTQSIEKLYHFIRNHSKKLPKAEQERIFNLFIKQWCQDKLVPVLEDGRPFSEIEKTVIKPLKKAIKKTVNQNAINT